MRLKVRRKVKGRFEAFDRMVEERLSQYEPLEQVPSSEIQASVAEMKRRFGLTEY